jgi:hypothetical protein
MNEAIELPKSEEQLAEERMASVERQIHEKLKPGQTRCILCPYCDQFNFPHRQFCCELLRDAVLAVLMVDRFDQIQKQHERQMDS